ncbi:MAG: zinc-ribbon domain-containing protein [Halobacteria archaeon]
MLKLGESEIKLRSLLKKIERGRGNEIIAESILKLLSKNEKYIAEFTPVIITCLRKQDINTLKYSTYLLRKIAQLDLKQVEDSIPLLLEILKKPPRAGEQEIRENSAILIYYASKVNPEVLKNSAGVIVENLDDLYSTVRRISYSTLLSITSVKPEYLISSIPLLIKALGSIHQDTRSAAAHILGIIGERYPRKVLNSYPYLKFLAWYHPNSEIRLEAAIALEKIERQLVTKEGICPIFGSSPEEKACNICKQQCELSIANPDHIIAKRLIKDLEQVKKNREAVLAKRIEAMPEEEKEEAQVKDEEELDELFKDIRKSFSAEKVLETLGLAHMIQPRESKCVNCGAILPLNAKYCIECGARVVEG